MMIIIMVMMMILMIMMSVSLSANFKQQQVTMFKSAYDIRCKGPTVSNVAQTLKMTPGMPNMSK